MNKYEKALEQIKVSNSVIGNIRLALGLYENGSPNDNNDKAYIQFWQGYNRTKPKLLNDDWTPAILWMEASHGYYGSSSGYNDMNEDVAYYFMKAIQSFTEQIAYKAIEIAEKDMQKAKKEAKEEAEKVLEKVK